MSKKSENFAIAWIPRLAAIAICLLTQVVVSQVTDSFAVVVGCGLSAYFVSLVIMRRNQKDA